MIIQDSVLQGSEKIVFALREKYLSHGYLPYRMSKFEEYDLYAQNKDFLVSDNVITFTDNGKLMALKPDVTLSIIKNTPDAPEKTRKVFYSENVYRAAEGTGSFREILQTGVECFGSVGEREICEVLTMAAESLRLFSERAVLSVSDLRILGAVVERLHLSGEAQAKLYRAIGGRNSHEIALLCAECADRAAVTLLKEILALHGTADEILPKLDAVLADERAYAPFRSVMQTLAASREASVFQIDFSIIGDINYYNGILCKGFLPDLPTAVLSGGQYDRLMQKLDRRSGAIGFAVYTDALERVETAIGEADGYLNVALPKGRLGEKIYDLFARAGFECPALPEPNRKLIFENPATKMRYFWVKPSDVAIYVERGAADVGVAGKDILLEYAPDVYELLDLKKGNCRMAVAAPNGYADDPGRTLRVATKFANIAKAFYRAQGRDIDVIHLNGSIEIAPILGLSDVIVDIVETGTTLKENDLAVVETILPISARLIANKAAFKFKSKRIEQIVAGLSAVTEGAE